MMGEATTRRNEVCAERRVFLCAEESVAAEEAAKPLWQAPRSAGIPGLSMRVQMRAKQMEGSWCRHCSKALGREPRGLAKVCVTRAPSRLHICPREHQNSGDYS